MNLIILTELYFFDLTGVYLRESVASYFQGQDGYV